jgi:putative intracellular protease/amidase
VLINLVAVGRASRPLADWWTRLLMTGAADVDELERARRLLEALPPQPGPLGRAVALVVSGGRDATQAETVAAVELLALAAARSGPIARVCSASGPRWRRPVQPPLPGFE